jgi:Integrase core domain
LGRRGHDPKGAARQPHAYVVSVVFGETMGALGITHIRIPPYRPRANGKVERFNRTLAEEWAYRRLYHSNPERLRAWIGGSSSTDESQVVCGPRRCSFATMGPGAGWLELKSRVWGLSLPRCLPLEGRDARPGDAARTPR